LYFDEQTIDVSFWYFFVTQKREGHFLC
jgi:hypothetical protein